MRQCSRSLHLQDAFEAIGGALAGNGKSDPYDFALPGDQPHYAPDRPADVSHVRLNLAVDLEEQRVSGVVTTTFRALFDDLRSVQLSASELEIEQVSLVGGPALRATQDGRKLMIELDRTYQHGETFAVEIAYAAHPRIGLHFVQPGPDDPTRPVQAWTQGQPETNHYWFPCHDSPNDRATTALSVTVPAQYFALSNGRLDHVDEDTSAGTKTYHWQHDVPHPAYLVTLVVGEFAAVMESWEGIPVTYYVRPGREADARAMMGKTPDMLDFYSRQFGVRYPYEKYAQIVCEIYTGAMENTSATTHSFALLPDARAALDTAFPKLVVAHELVHQWFGDLLTCRDWSHIWLNESFATYFEAAYVQHDDGEDEFRYELRNNLNIYLSEAYKRPIVYNVYNSDGWEMFDRHVYEKGSLVLHMLRFVLGESAFWRAIQHYAQSNRGREVITADLERAIEETTGRSMARFFEQWVYRAGHPEFEVSFNWDAEHKLASLTVKQAQKIDEHHSCFTTPVDIAFTLPTADDAPEGETTTSTFRVQIEEEQQRFYFPLPRKPLAVRFDAGGWILKTLKFERPAEMLRYQLAHDEDVLGRIEAAEALGKLGDPKSVEALAAALLSDPFWGVRAEIAATLGKLRTERALTALLAGLEQADHPRARRAIVDALGSFRAPEQPELAERAASVLAGVLKKGDASYHVEGAAASALGRTRASGAFEQLTAALDRPSWNEIIRSNIFQGLAALGDPAAADVLAEWVDRSKPIQARAAAANAMGALGSDHRLDTGAARQRLIDALIGALDDPWPPVRATAARALAKMRETSALGALDQMASRELDGMLIRAARLAAKTIREGKGPGDEARQLRTDLDEVREENRKLRERLETLEARLEQGS
jgi:aminopeptidase N